MSSGTGAIPVLARRPAAAPTATTASVSAHRQAARWYLAFAAFAGVVFAASGQPVQRTWGAWAAVGYGLAALIVLLWGSRGRGTALVVAIVGALAAPLTWQVTFGDSMSKADEDSLKVVARSGVLLLRHGTPYLPADQISHSLQYNPYEPAMAIFGLPAAVGLHGAAGNPRLWMGVTAAVVLAAAFRLAKPGTALRSTAVAFGSPVLALPLTQGLTDLPVLALLSLTLAGTAGCPPQRRARLIAGIALGAACAMKATAWPALPVIAAMLAARDGARAATRFVVTAGIAATALVAVTAPASVAAPGALFENTVLFPLGMARYQTEADSPLPGHLLAVTGAAGRWAAIGLLCAAGVAMVASLVVRPPADIRAAAWRLALTLALVFAVAPASRWGYFVYPAALLGFVWMTSSPAAAVEPGVHVGAEQ
ncbi:MAG TPA: hypothetical protein VEJ42_08320 [Streptosporangiaceae bacterium]|nr:hypothetical protein [Streptosporangiaceae bacterium]